MQRRSIVSLIVSSWFIAAVMISPALADDPAAPNPSATQSIPITVPATPTTPPTTAPADAPAVTAQTAAPPAALQSTPQPSATVLQPGQPAADPSRWDPYALPSQRTATSSCHHNNFISICRPNHKPPRAADYRRRHSARNDRRPNQRRSDRCHEHNAQHPTNHHRLDGPTTSNKHGHLQRTTRRCADRQCPRRRSSPNHPL